MARLVNVKLGSLIKLTLLFADIEFVWSSIVPLLYFHGRFSSILGIGISVPTSPDREELEDILRLRLPDESDEESCEELSGGDGDVARPAADGPALIRLPVVDFGGTGD